MDRHIRSSLAVLATIMMLLVIVASAPARAYIDAGTGTYLLQMLAACFLAGLIALRAFWGNIKQAVMKLGSKRPKE